MSQRQDSLLEQLRDVVVLAEQNGCYDAADWISRSLAKDWDVWQPVLAAHRERRGLPTRDDD